MLKKLKLYLPIIIMVIVAAAVGVLLLNGTLQVDQIIAAVDDNKPLAAAVILALFVFKGFSCLPYAAILVGCSLIFDLPLALVINTVGTLLCISVSYLVGRFSKGLTFDGMMEKYPKFKRYFNNATNYSFTFCFAVHTLHLSMEVQGVLFGLLRTRYSSYIAGSMLALLPSMVWYTVLGDQFDFTDPLLWVFLAIDLLTVVIGIFYAKRNIIDGGKKKEA
ncbi:MAG: VTT domain-containing protein [Oscillospiraceae bacterium]